MIHCRFYLFLMLGLFSVPAFSFAGVFYPVANLNDWNLDSPINYIQSTISGDWKSGTFGMVRDSGTKFHEGWDLRAFKRNSNGRVLDEVFSVCDGVIVHICNENNGSYGKYVVVEHQSFNIRYYSLYAHLDYISSFLHEGNFISAGTVLGIIGATSSTYKIPKGLEHLHFETGLRLSNNSFQKWYDRTFDKEDKNLHASWNGLNLSGLDPELFFRVLSKKRNSDFKTVLDSVPHAFSVAVYSNCIPEIIEHSPGLLKGKLDLDRSPVGWKVEFSWSGLPLGFYPIYATGNNKSIDILYVSNKYIHLCLKKGMVVSSGDTILPGNSLRNVLEIIFGDVF